MNCQEPPSQPRAQPKIQVAVRMPIHLYEKLHKLSEREKRTKNAQILLILEEKLEEVA